MLNLFVRVETVFRGEAGRAWVRKSWLPVCDAEDGERLVSAIMATNQVSDPEQVERRAELFVKLGFGPSAVSLPMHQLDALAEEIHATRDSLRNSRRERYAKVARAMPSLPDDGNNE